MGNHAYYLSIPPKDFPLVAEQLKASGLVDDTADQPDRWRRVVIEKPFGHDLASARALNDALRSAFPTDSIFRIDHYLGKETVQNILALRFANELYEPIWNRNYVDHVQITMAEDIGVGGRAGYYDGIGAARDVIQNHLLQLLALTAMEEPISFDAKDLRAEKEKVLAAVTLPKDLARSTARGQYAGGWQGGEKVLGFLEEDGMNPESTTETYAAITLEINTRRWAGVPFYLRTGKRLGRRVTEIAVVFKRAPELLFSRSQTSGQGQNALVIRVQPDEGVTIRFGSKVPGAGAQVRDVTMDFGYGHAFTEASPEAYERLILDVLLGDPPLFPRHEEVELSWKILDPIEQFWADAGRSARTVLARVVGPGIRGRDARPRRPHLEAPVIVDLPDTTVSKITRALVNVREEGGAVALGRVLTLVILTRQGAMEEVIEAANDASREHPMRVIVLMIGDSDEAESRLDAQIRVGGDAGASEVITLHVARRGRRVEPREPRHGPAAARRARSSSGGRTRRPTVPSQTSIGKIAQRRITDAATKTDPSAWVAALGEQLRPRRHRSRVDAPHPLARAARRDPRPAAVRGGHGGAGARRLRLAVHRAARRLAATRARRARRLGVPRPRGVAARHQVGDPRPRERRGACWSGPSSGDRGPHPARTARPRPRLPPPHTAGMPRRGAPSPRSGRPVWSSDHRGLGAPRPSERHRRTPAETHERDTRRMSETHG